MTRIHVGVVSVAALLLAGPVAGAERGGVRGTRDVPAGVGSDQPANAGENVSRLVAEELSHYDAGVLESDRVDSDDARATVCVHVSGVHHRSLCDCADRTTGRLEAAIRDATAALDALLDAALGRERRNDDRRRPVTGEPSSPGTLGADITAARAHFRRTLALYLRAERDCLGRR